MFLFIFWIINFSVYIIKSDFKKIKNHWVREMNPSSRVDFDEQVVFVVFENEMRVKILQTIM